MSAACSHCNGTGSLSKDAWGQLDCAHCDVADERVRFESWSSRAAPNVHALNAWVIYQHGKAAALEQAAQQTVAYAVTSNKGGIHKLSITQQAAERKATTWRVEWPNNGCRVRPLVFGD